MPTFQSGLQAELKRALENERNRLRQSLGWLGKAEQSLGESQAEESGAGGQQADVASDIAEQTLDATLEQVERRRLEEVEDAIQRLAEGHFGLCESCGRSIAEDRLVALPWTRLCLACASRRNRL